MKRTILVIALLAVASYFVVSYTDFGQLHSFAGKSRDFNWLMDRPMALDVLEDTLNQIEPTIYEMSEIVTYVDQEEANDPRRAKYSRYAVAGKVQRLMNDKQVSVSSESFLQIEASLAKANLFFNKKESNLSKGFRYLSACLMQGQQCDHLVDRIHQYGVWKWGVALMVLIVSLIWMGVSLKKKKMKNRLAN